MQAMFDIHYNTQKRWCLVPPQCLIIIRELYFRLRTEGAGHGGHAVQQRGGRGEGGGVEAEGQGEAGPRPEVGQHGTPQQPRTLAITSSPPPYRHRLPLQGDIGQWRSSDGND